MVRFCFGVVAGEGGGEEDASGTTASEEGEEEVEFFRFFFSGDMDESSRARRDLEGDEGDVFKSGISFSFSVAPPFWFLAEDEGMKRK